MADDFGTGAYLARMGQQGYSRPGADIGAGGGSFRLLETFTRFKDTQGFGALFNTQGVAAASVPGPFGVANKDAGFLPKALRSNASTEQILGPSGLIGPAHDVDSAPIPGASPVEREDRELALS